MSGGALVAACGGLKTIAVTVGSSGTETGFKSGAYGSISPTTFVDNAGNTRTPITINHDSGTTSLLLQCSGIIANSDAAFIAFWVNGVRYTRASAGYSAPVNTAWIWTLASTPFGSNRPVFLE